MLKDYERAYQKVENIISDMDTAEAVAIWNDYCDAGNHPYDMIYSMDEFDELMTGQDPWEIARSCYYGDFCPAHDYFWFNGYANACSSDFPDADKETPYCAIDLMRYILSAEDSLGNDEIQEILDEDAEEE